MQVHTLTRARTPLRGTAGRPTLAPSVANGASRRSDAGRPADQTYSMTCPDASDQLSRALGGIGNRTQPSPEMTARGPGGVRPQSCRRDPHILKTRGHRLRSSVSPPLAHHHTNPIKIINMAVAPNTFNAINGNGAVHPAHLDGTFAVKVSTAVVRQHWHEGLRLMLTWPLLTTCRVDWRRCSKEE